MSQKSAGSKPLPKYAQEIEETSAACETWDTELFVVSGADRSQLRQRLGLLLAFLERFPDVVLKDLAFSLNTALPAAGCRLAVVAGSVADLRTRLTRAADRLANASCEQIKDTTGVYFFAQPLHPEGQLAFLFPGEGAQYLNMLADMFPHFPDMRAFFDRADQAMAGGNACDQPLSSTLYLPPEATPAQRQLAEQKLRHLDVAMVSVLSADWVLFQLLQQLGIQAGAIAGHSAGELAALSAAGCLELDTKLITQVVTTMNLMQRLEEEGDGPEAMLLAVGAGRATVAELIQQKVGNQVFLAMDNCPHQTVVVGPAEPMAMVEAELQARRVLCERLSLRRPYHTFLFEPFLGPLNHLFAATRFLPPQTPIYSCTTARLFPADPDEIRRLTVSHWACPVEFTKMIDTMYADGVRLFVEVGPRGNLSAFVEDILRGRSFAAIPANIQRRSGLAQLNHLVGQLLAHHVPMQVEHLYRRRHPVRLEWEKQPEKTPLVKTARKETAGVRPASGPLPSKPQPFPSAERTLAPLAATPGTTFLVPPRGSRKSPVMLEYWNVMEQFLDMQNQVMAQFLSRPRKKKRDQKKMEVGQVLVDSPEDGRPKADQDQGPHPAAHGSWPLLGEIVRHQVGRELVMRRRLDLTEDLFAEHHTVGGRNVSKVDPQQHGLPVMPMTFSLEIMAEVAALLLPGKTPIALKKIKLFRWLAYDDQAPTTIEVTARLAPEPPAEPGATHQVHLEIRDLGNNREGKPQGATSQGIVLLGERFPTPPPVDDFPLTDEDSCRIAIRVLYNNLFHGPLFQGVRSLGRIGNEGIEGSCVVPERTQLFTSTATPTFIIDPVLADVVMHPLAGWHLEQPDQSGRIILPFELEKIELFGPPPEVGTKITSRVRTVESSGRHFVHTIEAIRPDGQLWCRLNRLKYWRFFVPFGDVNFHGSKDEYFISKEWPEVLLPEPTKQPQDHEAQETPKRPGIFAEDKKQRCCIRLDMPADQRQANMRLVTAKATLSGREWQEFRRLSGPDRQLNDWLFGRLAAKDAIRVLWHARYGERLFPADIEVDIGPRGQLTARHRGSIPPEAFPAVSYAHIEEIAVGLAAFGSHAGVEIVRVKPGGFEALATDERELLQGLKLPDEWAARLYSAKEAVAKALGQRSYFFPGPSQPDDRASRALPIKVCDLQVPTGKILVALDPALAAIFPQFASTPLIAYTVCQEDLVVATTFLERGPL